MADDEVNAGDANWQYKYYDTLEQLEQKEKQFEHIETALRRAISRLSLAADGRDDQLDEYLKELRRSIRDGVDHASLQQLIEVLSERMVVLDEKHTRERKLRPGEPLLALVDVIAWPRGLNRELKHLRRQLEQAEDQQALHDPTRAFAELIAAAAARIAAEQAAAPAEDEAAAPPKAGGLFGRLFQRDRGDAAPPTAEAPAAAATAPGTPAGPTDLSQPLAGASPQLARDLLAELLDGLRLGDPAAAKLARLRSRLPAAGEPELRDLAGELAQLLSGLGAAAGGVAEAPAESAPDAAELLLELLERLSLPDELASRAEAIRRRIEEAGDAEAWQRILEEIADLIADLRSRVQRERSDLESFLTQVTERLADVDQHLQGVDSSRQESLADTRELNSRVHDHVRGISSSVQGASDLELLKHEVQRTLDVILSHVEEHRGREEDRSARLEKQVQQLSGRLREVERESGELRQRLSQERSAAATDALTGIPNRLAYDERIEQEYKRWKRLPQPLTLVVADVDFFKKVNDSYGHKAGDKVLVTIAQLLSKQIRESDLLARYGGEEFVIVMPGASAAAAFEVADKLRMAVDQTPFHYHGTRVPVTVSCGVAQFRDDDTPDTVFERADAALYRAKQNGRNRCEAGD